MAELRNSIDRQLRERARRVVPGGMWGHMHADRLPDGYPQFFARAEGCRLWDVDGHEYLDFMCSWGPVLLGHRHPVVEEAVRKQVANGDCMNGPAEVMVELAELLVAQTPHADWAQFQKNGTDATTTCVTIARAGTRRRKLLVARGSYHGAVPWCSPSLAGVTAEDRAHILHFDYNDVASLENAVDQAGDDLAAVLVSAFRHDLGRDQEMPEAAFALAARRLCDQTGAALIIDDVRAGFRLHPGGSWEPLGVQPDLSAWSKAIANGYPLAAVTGNDRFREAATQVFTTGSFWCGAVPDGGGIGHAGDHPRRGRDRPPHRGRHAPARRAGCAGAAARVRAAPDRAGADADDAVRQRSGMPRRCRFLRRGVAARTLSPSAPQHVPLGGT